MYSTTSAALDTDVARLQCRFVIYKKGLKEKVDVVSPKVYGGMKSDEYMALNPQGLVPMLVLPDGESLWESDVSISVRPGSGTGSAPQLIKTCQQTTQAQESGLLWRITSYLHLCAGHCLLSV